jgi:hypothetical protein
MVPRAEADRHGLDCEAARRNRVLDNVTDTKLVVLDAVLADEELAAPSGRLDEPIAIRLGADSESSPVRASDLLLIPVHDQVLRRQRIRRGNQPKPSRRALPLYAPAFERGALSPPVHA